ncbi:hypothetical protein CW304_30955 [Bacillus sp. UFRGS-B20]|nr:hypothetical protein CW304_30955 [Bacillus sp. UFRGS-B20]
MFRPFPSTNKFSLCTRLHSPLRTTTSIPHVLVPVLKYLHRLYALLNWFFKSPSSYNRLYHSHWINVSPHSSVIVNRFTVNSASLVFLLFCRVFLSPPVIFAAFKSILVLPLKLQLSSFPIYLAGGL